MWGAWKRLADAVNGLAATLTELDRRVRASFALDEAPALAAPPAGLPAAGANGAAAKKEGKARATQP